MRFGYKILFLTIFLLYGADPCLPQSFVNYDFIIKAVMERIKPELDGIRSELSLLRSEVKALTRNANVPASANSGNLVLSVRNALLKIVANGIASVYDSNLQELLKLLGGKSPDTVISFANAELNSKRYTNAILLFYCAGKLETSGKDGSKSLRMGDMMATCIKIKQKKPGEIQTAKAIVFHLMEDLLQEIRSERIATKVMRVVDQGFGYYFLATCYDAFDDFNEAFKMAQTGIDFIEHEFGESASNFQVLGHCYKVAGDALRGSGNFSKALSYYNSALAKHYSATDFPSEKDRQNSIAAASQMIAETIRIRELQ